MKSRARKKIRHDDETRAKIQAALIINRLQDCLAGKIELSPAQVTCAKTLLDKVLPNLQAVDFSADPENIEYFVSDHPLTAEEYEKKFAKGVVDAASGAATPAHQLPN